MPLVLRNIKQTELTWTELDDNFVYLENKINDVENQTVSNDIVKVTAQSFLPEQQAQGRANLGAASVESVEDLNERLEFVELIYNLTEATFTHEITQNDVDHTTTFTVQLPNTPIPSTYNLLFIQGGFVNPTKYTIVGDVLSFEKADVYNLVVGKLITLIYKY
ncbi:hypothetical protein P3875_04110 [Myroides sp. JBRI-B21084]|uniref:hypothetical protein n=1 Tax=Myroides sp. JBRI-B21084 TaxID=3119977 RepID=UPI0026E46B30|nr:hypothetical protein [Paenimyroides cloacae]WKW47256.1 hypothetical protein P3875_04110 [Paenimyroides cloacae]